MARMGERKYAIEPIPDPDDRTTDFDPDEEYSWDPDMQTSDDEWGFEEEDEEGE